MICNILLDSPYRTAMSGAVLKLQEEGKLHILKTRWWKEKRGGGSCRVRTNYNKLIVIMAVTKNELKHTYNSIG